MELDPQKKRQEKLEKVFRTPKAVMSREKPTEEDEQETNYLIQTFLAGKFYLFENHQPDASELEEIKTREQVLTDLKDIIKNWIVSVAKQTGTEENFAKDEEAKLFTFGSHRLGVNSRGGDIDCVVLCPNYVDRKEHFFGQMYEILSREPHVTELVKVDDVKVTVPVIKMNFRDIPVDLAFIKLNVTKIDSRLKNLNDNDLLASVADKNMVYSMNGPRNVDFIIQAVDQREDSAKVANFRTALRILKLWAKNRGIYSNAMGYVTGISLAILVAKICQLFPFAKPNKIIQMFFIYYSAWNWAEFPVKIEEIKVEENLEQFNEMQWYDPFTELGQKREQKKKDEWNSPMMVITPAFPVMNATRKVNKTNLNVMKEQFSIGKEITMKKPVDWKKLLERVDFFNLYNNFIEVCIVANEESEFNRWNGLMESQMIALTNDLEYALLHYEEAGCPMFLHPYPVDFSTTVEGYEYCCTYYYGIKPVNPEVKASEIQLDLFMAINNFVGKMVKRRIEGRYMTANLRIMHLTREELPASIFEEKVPAPKPSTKDASLANKRLLDEKLVENDNEYEPAVGKKFNDLESKSTHLSTTSSPKEYNNGIHKEPMMTIENTTTARQEGVRTPTKNANGYASNQNSNSKNDSANKQETTPIKTVVKPVVKKVIQTTTFALIENASALQSSELDDFL